MAAQSTLASRQRFGSCCHPGLFARVRGIPGQLGCPQAHAPPESPLADDAPPRSMGTSSQLGAPHDVAQPEHRAHRDRRLPGPDGSRLRRAGIAGLLRRSEALSPRAGRARRVTPSQHHSGRSLSDGDATLWSSWVIQSDGHKVFISGDTGLTEQFRETGDTYGPFDLVLLEIDEFHPGFEPVHLGPENALKVLQMLGGGTLLPVHWGTFDLALQGLRVVTPSLGQVVEPSQLDGPTPWWRDLESKEAAFPPPWPRSFNRTSNNSRSSSSCWTRR